MVQRFIGVCTGWLTGHIIIEDRAIIEEGTDRLPPMRPDDESSVIHSVVVLPLQEILGCKIQYVGRFSAEDEVVIEIAENKKRVEQEVEASFDGSVKMAMYTGDRMEIRRAEKVTEILKLKQDSFVEVLHRKME